MEHTEVASPWTVNCICRHTLCCQFGITSCSCSKPLMDLQKSSPLESTFSAVREKHIGAPVRDSQREQESS